MSEINSLSEKLDELIFWTKFSALPTFRTLLRDALRDEVDRLVYELSDGGRSTREIAHLISRGGRRITHVTVANMWQKWSLMNLVMPAGRKGRYKRVVSLESIGIEVPPMEVVHEERRESSE
ncbi:hypothetical protein IBX38_07535 [Candidatus Bathyarchaeota archaeon]|nr:hypothetical protein [Candidatus Bathyarchaeota archaeon]